MVDPDWIQIFNRIGKQHLSVCKGEGHCIRISAPKIATFGMYQAKCWIKYCLVYFAAYNLIIYPIKLLSWVFVERPFSFIVLAVITHFLRDNKAVHKTDNTFKVCCCLRNQIRNDISCELSTGR